MPSIDAKAPLEKAEPQSDVGIGWRSVQMGQVIPRDAVALANLERRLFARCALEDRTALDGER